MTQLPPTWSSAFLGDVASFTMGQAPPSATCNDDGIGMPFYRSGEFGARIPLLRKWTTKPLKLGSATDVFLCVVGANCGECNLGADGAIGRSVAAISPAENLDQNFLFHYLTSRRADLNAGSQGSAQGVITRSDLRSLSLPLPPIEEQKRIVDILEDHLSRLDAASNGVLTARSHVDGLRLSLISRQLNSAGGDFRTIDEVSMTVRNGIFVSRPGSTPNGVPILRIGAVRSLALDLSDLRYSGRDERSLAAEGSLLNTGDLLFTRYNGNPQFVGACAVVPANIGPLTYPDKLIRVVLDARLVLPEFVALACSVGPGRAKIQSFVKTTSGQAGIAGRDLRNISIRVPALDIQANLVQRVTIELEAITRLIGDMAAASRRAGRLRRSLLAAAFSGRLTGSSIDTEILEELANV